MKTKTKRINLKMNNQELYIKKGYIDLDDNMAFGTICDVCNCFGCNYKGYQRVMARHPYERDTVLWFPKLYGNNEWDNSITPDGKVIYEKPKVKSREEFIDSQLSHFENYKRIVFAGTKGSFGYTIYKFKGAFMMDADATRRERMSIYNRIETQVKTYSTKGK